MPNDIAMTWDTMLQGGAISFADNDITTSRTLLTPVLVSLFTDARAADDDSLPDADTDRGGCWMDATNTAKSGDSIGSKLWLLRREKTSSAVVVKAKTYAEAALKWMTDEGVVKSVVVTTERQTMSGDPNSAVLALVVALTKPDGTSESFKFELEWEATI